MYSKHDSINALNQIIYNTFICKNSLLCRCYVVFVVNNVVLIFYLEFDL